MAINEFQDVSKSLDLFAEAKEQGFTYKLEQLHHDSTDRTAVLYGNFWGKDFKLISSGKEEAVVAIRAIGALNAHKEEIENLKDGEELKLAHIGHIEYSEEYTNDDYGYADYFVTKENGELNIKRIEHAQRWISSPVLTTTATLDKFINTWF